MIMAKTAKPKIGWGLIMELAVAASVDPTTIKKVLAGKPVRGMAGVRAHNLLVARGILEA